MKAGITVECVFCKAQKTLTLDEARGLDGPPLCEKDGGPMIAISAKVRSRRKGGDIRDAFR